MERRDTKLYILHTAMRHIIQLLCLLLYRQITVRVTERGWFRYSVITSYFSDTPVGIYLSSLKYGSHAYDARSGNSTLERLTKVGHETFAKWGAHITHPKQITKQCETRLVKKKKNEGCVRRNESQSNSG